MSKALFMAAAAGAGAVAPTYVDDVFSTYLYTGTGPGSGQTITNGIDLAGQGGMVWIKERGASSSHYIFDTIRGGNNSVSSDLTLAAISRSGALTSFTNNGFTLGTDPNTIGVNRGGVNTVSWTFRKAPKFFDVVTWTGNDSNRDIAHTLGVAPGCIFVKRTDTTGDWQVYHRSLANTEYLLLNSTARKETDFARWNSTANASTFRIGTDASVNASGGTYVAYVFAHDTATDGFIQCGSFTTNGSGEATVTLGWEPQFLIVKDVDSAGDWYTFDTMRAWTVAEQPSAILVPNTSGAEFSSSFQSAIRADGFSVAERFVSANNIYIAIRRPNKPPTTGTQVFEPQVTAVAVDAANPRVLPIPASDMWIDTLRTGFERDTASRITGWNYLETGTTDPEDITYNWAQYTQTFLNPQQPWWAAGDNQIVYHFKRAPGFFDVVAYTGNGGGATIAPHSLGRPPEMIIVRSRTDFGNWYVYHAALGNTSAVILNADIPAQGDLSEWSVFTPDATTFRTSNALNSPGVGYIAYLFATLPGISKVGLYIGNGSSQTINCGFTTGARFVLIKRTDSTGDWYVWDTARGIVSGNDPHLSLNSTTAEVTTDDSIDPAAAGFIVNQVAATNVNVNAATYIFLAIA